MENINCFKQIEEFRSHVPAVKEWAYFESAGTGLIPDFVYEGIQRYQNDRFYKGGDSCWSFEDGRVGTLEMIDRSKAALAEMLHCKMTQIAFGQSATQMFTMVTEGIDYGPRDNIVTVANGFIGNRYAWQKKELQGLEVRYAIPAGGSVSISDLTALCDENTRAVSVNLVENQTGFRLDIEELGNFCKENGILLFADAVQAVGVLDINIGKANIDFLVGNDYKWMMNYCGTGFAYISEKLLPLITHWGAGWMSDTDRFNTGKDRLTLRSDAGRFEIGYPHADGIYGMGLVAGNNCKIGMKNIELYVCSLADYFRERIEALPRVRNTYRFDKKNCCQIVSIKLSPKVTLTNEDLEKRKIFAHIGEADESGEREIRLGFHYYNNKHDIDRLIDVLQGGMK